MTLSNKLLVAGLALLVSLNGGASEAWLPAPELSKAFQQAHETGHYELKVLRRRLNGNLQTVVLIGERHLKNEEASQLGREIIRHFKLFGLEGMPPVSGKYVLHREMENIYELHHWISSFTGESYGSTIKEVQELARANQELDIIRLEYMDSVPFRAIQELSSESKTVYAIRFILSLTAGMLVPYALLDRQVLWRTPGFDSLWYLNWGLVTLSLVYSSGLLNALMPDFLSTAFANQRVGTIDDRNEIFAKRIQDGFSKRGQTGPMAVIIGKTHLPGLTKILMNTYQFEYVPLEAIE